MRWTDRIFLLTYHVIATLARTRSGVVCGSDGRTYDADDLLLAQTKHPSLTLLHYGPCDQKMVCGSNGITYQNRYKLMLEKEIDPSLNILHSGPCSSYEDQTQYDDTSILTPNTLVCGTDLRTYRYHHLQLAQIEDPHLDLLYPGPCGLNKMPIISYVKRPGDAVGTYPVGSNRVVGKNGIGRSAMGAEVSESNKETEGAGLGSFSYGGSTYSHEDYSRNKQWGGSGWETQQCDGTCHNPGQCGGQGQPPCQNQYLGQCGGPGQLPCQNQFLGQCGGPGQPPCQNQYLGQCGGPGQPPCQNQYLGQCGGPGQSPCLNQYLGQCGGPGQPPCQNQYLGQCGGPGQPPCLNLYHAQCGQPGQSPCLNLIPGQSGGTGQPSCNNYCTGQPPCPNYPGSSQIWGYPGQTCQNPGGCTGQLFYGLGAAEGGGGLGSAPEKSNDKVIVERRSSKLREKKSKRGGIRGGRPLMEVGNKGFNLIVRSGSELGDKDLRDRRNRSKRSDGRWLPPDPPK